MSSKKTPFSSPERLLHQIDKRFRLFKGIALERCQGECVSEVEIGRVEREFPVAIGLGEAL